MGRNKNPLKWLGAAGVVALIAVALLVIGAPGETDEFLTYPGNGTYSQNVFACRHIDLVQVGNEQKTRKYFADFVHRGQVIVTVEFSISPDGAFDIIPPVDFMEMIRKNDVFYFTVNIYGEDISGLYCEGQYVLAGDTGGVFSIGNSERMRGPSIFPLNNGGGGITWVSINPINQSASFNLKSFGQAGEYGSMNTGTIGKMERADFQAILPFNEAGQGYQLITPDKADVDYYVWAITYHGPQFNKDPFLLPVRPQDAPSGIEMYSFFQFIAGTGQIAGNFCAFTNIDSPGNSQNLELFIIDPNGVEIYKHPFKVDGGKTSVIDLGPHVRAAFKIASEQGTAGYYGIRARQNSDKNLLRISAAEVNRLNGIAMNVSIGIDPASGQLAIGNQTEMEYIEPGGIKYSTTNNMLGPHWVKNTRSPAVAVPKLAFVNAQGAVERHDVLLGSDNLMPGKGYGGVFSAGSGVSYSARVPDGRGRWIYSGKTIAPYSGDGAWAVHGEILDDGGRVLQVALGKAIDEELLRDLRDFMILHLEGGAPSSHVFLYYNRGNEGAQGFAESLQSVIPGISADKVYLKDLGAYFDPPT